jgi:hypothetical protein
MPSSRVRPIVFVGSSKEQIEIARIVTEWLEKCGCDARLWENQFAPGDITIVKLVEIASEADGAMFIFGEDDKTWYREQIVAAVRDNVILEFGLFLGAVPDDKLKRVVICRVGGPRLSSDLGGLTFVPFDRDKLQTAQNIVGRWAKTLTPRISGAMASAGVLREAHTKQQLFEEGTRLLRAAKTRVHLFAKTPIPYMGARPYETQSDKFDYELEQYSLYMDIADKAGAGEIELTVCASVPCVKSDLRHVSSAAFAKAVKRNTAKLYRLQDRPGSKLRLFWYRGTAPATFVVVDDEVLIWWKSANQDMIWVRECSAPLAHALRLHGRESVKGFNRDRVEKMLGI